MFGAIVSWSTRDQVSCGITVTKDDESNEGTKQPDDLHREEH